MPSISKFYIASLLCYNKVERNTYPSGYVLPPIHLEGYCGVMYVLKEKMGKVKGRDTKNSSKEGRKREKNKRHRVPSLAWGGGAGQDGCV
jgi:hypothetical protein